MPRPIPHRTHSCADNLEDGVCVICWEESQQDPMEFLVQALKDNPISRFVIKPEIHIENRYAEHIGWRATWEEVGSGAMVEWELFSIGKTPEATLEQFVKDLAQAFDDKDFRQISNKPANRIQTGIPHMGA